MSEKLRRLTEQRDALDQQMAASAEHYTGLEYGWWLTFAASDHLRAMHRHGRMQAGSLHAEWPTTDNSRAGLGSQETGT